MTWGSNSTGTKSECRFCGSDEYDDLDEWPYTSHHYECPDRFWWNRFKKVLGINRSNLPKATLITK